MNRLKARASIALLTVVAAACGNAGSESNNGAVSVSTERSSETQASVADGPEPACAYNGADPDFGYMQVELTFTNPLGPVNGLEVTYALLDGADGTRFFTGTAGGLDVEDIHFPSSSETFRLSLDTREDLPSGLDEASISCAVLAIEEITDIGGYERSTGADSCEVLAAGSTGNIEVELTATSPYDDTTTVQIWWALMTPAAVRFETASEVVELVAGGETFRVSPRYGTERPEWIGDGEITCAVLGFWNHNR